MEFEALKTFPAPQFRSIYTQGLRYRVRPGHTDLAHAVEQWERDGLVRYVDIPRAIMSGIGTVK